MARYLPGGAQFGKDPDIPMITQTLQNNFMQALDQLQTAMATPGNLAETTRALGKALIFDMSLSVNKT